MKFPWHKYEELPAIRRNTLQMFITSACNLSCDGCFVKSVSAKGMMSSEEYHKAILAGKSKGAQQINILGGEPTFHPQLLDFIYINNDNGLKTTIYTNGYRPNLKNLKPRDLMGAKLRISLYCKSGGVKSAQDLYKTELPIDICFMVSSTTTLDELVETAYYIEDNYNCDVFFISSIRELNNPRHEFFEDTELSMPVIKYKQLVHDFLQVYDGKMQIHISKRGVFESTKTIAGNTCMFANYFIGGDIVQCPYDIVNGVTQKDYNFGTRHCQHNNTCMMSKIILKPKI